MAHNIKWSTYFKNPAGWLLIVCYGVLIGFISLFINAYNKINNGLFLPSVGIIISFIVIVGLRRYLCGASPSQAEQSNSVQTLTEQQRHLIQKHAPTAQLPVINDVLLVSLGLTHDLLSRLPAPNSHDANLFETKYRQIIQLFQTLNQHSYFKNSTITTRSRNNAILIAAFYRLLFSGVLTQAIDEGILNSDTDRWILLKRIPPKMSQYLGSQWWRVYELKILVYGDLDALELNEDIQPLLKQLFADKQSDRGVDSQDQSDTKSHVSSYQEIDINQLQHDLKEWIKVRVQDQPANQSQYFFADVRRFGNQTVFVSDTALSDFADSQNLAFQTVQSNLSHISDQYQIECQSDQTLFLFKMEIDSPIEVMQLPPATIKEVSL